jgi:Protein of unknown function (DUF3800)
MGDAEAYFDESGDARFFGVGGYIFRRADRIAMEEQWKGILDRYGVPYFHMKEATNPDGFLELSPADTVGLSIALHDLIKQFSAAGYAVTFDLSISNLLPSALVHGLWKVSPYVLCCYYCLLSVRAWTSETGYNDTVDYFFEQGHKSQADAHRVMSDIFAVPELKAAYRYGGHAFVTKQQCLPLQAADILAWHWRKYIHDRSAGKLNPRADLASLWTQPLKYNMHHLDTPAMLEFLQTQVQMQNPSV